MEISSIIRPSFENHHSNEEKTTTPALSGLLNLVVSAYNTIRLSDRVELLTSTANKQIQNTSDVASRHFVS